MEARRDGGKKRYEAGRDRGRKRWRQEEMEA